MGILKIFYKPYDYNFKTTNFKYKNIGGIIILPCWHIQIWFHTIFKWNIVFSNVDNFQQFQKDPNTQDCIVIVNGWA
jgi:hypothetical protein